MIEPERFTELDGPGTAVARQSRNVIDVRCYGLIAAIEMAPREGEPMQRGIEAGKHCYEAGLWARNIGDALVLSPPLIITEEIVFIFDTIVSRFANK
ncbi:MAG: hypothetical protein U5O39_04675 [Gammaproteobacteria bacterium]|nr:hypothetical protein [Gammaproteobacteria bacterium]